MAKSVLTIAIDFGTAYSGYHVKCNTPGKGAQFRDIQWGEEYGIRSCKTPTCALFDSTECFLEFGYAAMKKYTKGVSKGKGLFFENFKMDLYKNKVIQSDLQVTAANGGKMPAMIVFTECLRYLKDHVLRKIENFSAGTQLRDSDITWVLTVPAIWTNAAKQFMRDAATNAGLVTDSDPDRLILALEPEAASVYCKQLPSDGFVGGENDNSMRLDQMPGTQYIVADCGGGTIDITLHEVLDGGALKEVSKASGNDLGGQNIDRQLKSFLKEIFGDECWEEYETNHTHELQKLMYEFAITKCADDNEGISFPCTFNLVEIVKKHRNQNMRQLLKGHQGVTWNDGSIDISPEKFKSFFDESLRGIARSLKDFWKNPEFHISHLLLVGGYALCQILQNYIKGQFGKKCKILCPQHPQLAVMVGAADFGSQPKIVASRISGLTYGIITCELFDETKHNGDKFTNSDGEVFCDNIFKRLVMKGESVGCDETRNYTFVAVDREQTSMDFTFYSTTRPNALYRDDWGMEQMATLTVPIGNPGRPRHEREVSLDVKFGFTEITATATDLKSKNSQRITLNFMKE